MLTPNWQNLGNVLVIFYEGFHVGPDALYQQLLNINDRSGKAVSNFNSALDVSS